MRACGAYVRQRVEGWRTGSRGSQAFLLLVLLTLVALAVAVGALARVVVPVSLWLLFLMLGTMLLRFVPLLLLVGELDDWTPANECRNLAEGRDDWGISREKGQGVPIQITVYPGAYHDFDVPRFRAPEKFLGHHLEFNEAARDQSVDAVRQFLYETIGKKEQQP